MDMATKAKKAAILMMMNGFPSSQDRVTAETIRAYLLAVDDLGVEAVERSCRQFARGLVENRNNAFMPTAAELASNARLWQDAIGYVDASRALAQAQRITPYRIGESAPPPATPLGPTRLEVEGLMRDTSDWSHDEKEEAIRTGKMPQARRVGGAIENVKRLRDGNNE